MADATVQLEKQDGAQGKDFVSCVKDKARAGAPAGTCVWSPSSDALKLALVLRPAVKMGDYHALPFVAAMGAVDALRSLGKAHEVGIRWPSDLVSGAPDFDSELVCITVSAGAGEGGLFAVVGLSVSREPLETLALDTDDEELAADLCDAIAARVDSWASALAASKVVAGPLAPVLEEYFDMVPLLGHRAAALSPNGHPLALGTFAGIDVWGRATIKNASAEREFAPEAARIRAM